MGVLWAWLGTVVLEGWEATYSLVDAVKSVRAVWYISAWVRGLHQDLAEAHTKVVSRQDLVLESMLGADGDNGLVGAQGLERLAFPCGLSPEHLLFQDMEEGDDVSEAAGLASATDHGITVVHVW